MIDRPSLDDLMSHLAKTTDETLDAGASDKILSALIWDCHYRFGIHLSGDQASALAHPGATGAAQAVACRVMTRLKGLLASAERLMVLFDTTLPELARLSKPDRWLKDPEGTEEFVRLILRDLQVTPAGETESRAADRLQSVSLLERRRLIGLSRDAEARAREVRQALQAKAAKEAADKYTRE